MPNQKLLNRAPCFEVSKTLGERPCLWNCPWMAKTRLKRRLQQRVFTKWCPAEKLAHWFPFRHHSLQMQCKVLRCPLDQKEIARCTAKISTGHLLLATCLPQIKIEASQAARSEVHFVCCKWFTNAHCHSAGWTMLLSIKSDPLSSASCWITSSRWVVFNLLFAAWMSMASTFSSKAAFKTSRAASMATFKLDRSSLPLKAELSPYLSMKVPALDRTWGIYGGSWHAHCLCESTGFLNVRARPSTALKNIIILVSKMNNTMHIQK